jgi:predicted RNA-binding protein (virulence factor B family)
VQVGDALSLYVAERTMLGYNVNLLDHNDFTALLFHSSIYGPPPFVGDTIQGFVCNIREDGKVSRPQLSMPRGAAKK